MVQIQQNPPPKKGGGQWGGGGLLGTLLQVGGAIYNSNQNRKNTKDTIEANKAQSEYAYSKDLEMWNRNNDYNSPANQMARLKAGGLNPNMVYGTGTQAAGMAAPSQMPKYNAPTLKYDYEPAVNLPQIIGAYQDFKMRQAQTDNIQAATENTRARTVGEGLKQALTTSTTSNKDFDLRKKEGLWTYDVEMKNLQNKKLTNDLSTQVQKLRLMSQEEQTNALQQRYKEKALSMQDIEMEKKQAELIFQKYKNDWMKMGITSGDNVVLRMLARMANEAGIPGFDVPTTRPQDLSMPPWRKNQKQTP